MDSIVTLRNGTVYEGQIRYVSRHEMSMRLVRTGDLTIFPTYAIASTVETTHDSFGRDGDSTETLRCGDCNTDVYYDTADDLYYHRNMPESGVCWMFDTGNGNTADEVQCRMATLGHHAAYDLGGFAQVPRWTCSDCGATTIKQRHGGLEGSGLTKRCTS